MRRNACKLKGLKLSHMVLFENALENYRPRKRENKRKDLKHRNKCSIELQATVMKCHEYRLLRRKLLQW